MVLKPDLVILIDSFITNDIHNLNKSIILNNKGIISGMGIKYLNDEISCNTLKTNVITIGVPTVLELNFKNQKSSYILSTKDVDLYVKNISKVIGNVLNKIIYEIL